MGMKPSKLIWFDGHLVPWDQANVHVMTHALHYGSSVFEGMRAYATGRGAAIFRLRDHTKRLFGSARIHRLAIAHSIDEIDQACREVVRRNGLSSAYVRPIAFRGVGDLSLTGSKGPVHVAIAAFEWGAYLGEDALGTGVDACVSSWQRAAPNTFPTMAKAGGNYLSAQLIGSEAVRHGYTEGISLDQSGYVSEGSGENIFVIKDGRLITPPLWSSILPGLTRDSVIVLARELGLDVREEPIPREALYLADELFFTGTAAEISPIRSVDGLSVGEGRRGPITELLQKQFFGLFAGTTPDRHGWLDFIGGPALAVAEA